MTSLFGSVFHRHFLPTQIEKKSAQNGAPELLRISDPAHRAHLAELIARYGSGAHAIALAPRFRLFKVPHIDGGVAFIRRAGCSVAFGDPLCLAAQKRELAQTFATYCKQRGWPLVYIAGSDAFAQEALHLQHGYIPFGTEHVINPATNPLRSAERALSPSTVLSQPADPALAEAMRKAKAAHKRAQSVAQRQANAEQQRLLAESGPKTTPAQKSAIAALAFKDAQALRDANRAEMLALEKRRPLAAPPPPPTEAKKEIRRNITNIQHQINAGQRAGVTISAYDARAPDADKEAQMWAVTKRWLAARTGPQVFAGIIDPFAARATGRWFIAECDVPVTTPQGEPARLERRVVGLVTLTRLADVSDAQGDTQKGWLIDHMVSDAEPRGISQMLVKHAIETLASEGHCDRLTWGIASCPALGESQGLSRWATAVAQRVHARSNSRFHFENKINFRVRFMPERQEALNLMFYPAKVGAHQVLGIMKAMNVGFSANTVVAMLRAKPQLNSATGR